ncbi:MAG: hypothetical protein WB615_05075 [Candidatus Tumulicola sp.]
MKLTKTTSLLTGMLVAFAATVAVAAAQESPASPPPAPAPIASDHPTPMDVQYDGRTHILVAPYVWAPTVKGNFQFQIPRLGQHGGGNLQSNVQVGPSDYAQKLNAAGMLAFDARKGEVDLFGDVIYLNASTSASLFSTISGPLGGVQIPVNVNANARLSVVIWEAAAGFTVAHGHNADLSAFAGVRQFPLDLTVDYTATVGKRGIIAPSGTSKTSVTAPDVIFGLRGKAFLGDSRWFVPYYIDAGAGYNNQTWEAYTGAGTAFNHGQTLLLVWRSLNYSGFPANSTVQKLSMGGPLIGYTFNL